jgi:hypothetical protein
MDETRLDAGAQNAQNIGNAGLVADKMKAMS